MDFDNTRLLSSAYYRFSQKSDGHVTSFFLNSNLFLMQNLMVDLKFWNSNFLEFVGIKFETNHSVKNVIVTENFDNSSLLFKIFFLGWNSQNESQAALIYPQRHGNMLFSVYSMQKK